MRKPTERAALLKARDHFRTGELPLAVLRMPVAQDVRFHSHEYTELVLVTQGEGQHVTGVDTRVIRAGDVFVIHTGQAHAYRELRGLEVINILYDSPVVLPPSLALAALPGYQALFALEPLLRRRQGLDYRLSLGAADLTTACGLAEAMRGELAGRAPGYSALAGALMVQLAVFLSRCYSRVRAPEPRALMRLGRVLTSMEEHLTEPLSLAGLARTAGMSRSTLTRAFRRILRRSPIEHLIRLRLERACVRLRETDDTVTEIALAVGFNDSNYFARQFRRLMGRTPRAYRREFLQRTARTR